MTSTYNTFGRDFEQVSNKIGRSSEINYLTNHLTYSYS